MKIVLDTNVLARATPGKAGPAAALLLAIRDPHQLVLSPYLLTELARVLHYSRVRSMHGMSDPQIDEYLVALQSNALIVDVSPLLAEQIVPNDADDDPIVATAVAGQANFLCTLDKHLRCQEVVDYCAGHDIKVVSDVKLLQLLG